MTTLTRQFITARIDAETKAGNLPRTFLFAGHPSMPLFGWNGTHEIKAHPTMLYDFLDNEIRAQEQPAFRARDIVPQSERIDYYDANGRLNIVSEPTVNFTGAHGILKTEGLGDVENPETLEVSVTMVLPVASHDAMVDRYAFDFSASVKGAPAMMWLGWLDAEGNLIDNLVPWMTLTLNQGFTEWTGSMFEFKLSGTPGIFTTQAPSRLAWSGEQQRSDLRDASLQRYVFPGTEPITGNVVDTGFDAIELLHTRTAIWAQGSRRSPEPLTETPPPQVSVAASVIEQILAGIPPTP